MTEQRIPHTHAAAEGHSKPNINVTPLIDVLLVVMIIFMVISPLKPARFLTKVPAEPDRTREVHPNPKTLVVTIKPDRSLMLNHESDLGSIDDPGKLSARLFDVFQERTRNHAYRDGMLDRIDLPDDIRIEKTVFIKAPGSLPYGEVVRVLDSIKGAGATPVGLQIDGLD